MEEEGAAPTFMCSKLYVAASEGRTEEVTRILTGSGQAASPAARKGRPRPSSAAAPANASHPGRSCSTREVTAERRTLLHIAAGQGHCGLINELARRDRDLLSSLTSSQDTPLHFAARAGHVDAVAVIVRLIASREDDDDSGDDVEEARRRLRLQLRGVHDVLGAKNRAGDTALHVAARHGGRGAAAAVEALMDLAPGLAAELNGAGVSPLYLAVVSGSVRAVAAIVAYGDDAAAAGPMSQNALHAAVLQSSEMVSLLLQWRPTLASDLDSKKSSPLHFAASSGDCSIIEDILKHAPPSTAYMQDSQGLSALHAAALMGHLPAVRLLLQYHPASSDIRDNHGRNFLHAAAMRGHHSIISYVIKNQMLEYLLNEQDQEGNTTLHLALQAGEYRVVSKLLSSGKMQVHIMNNDGHTPSDLIENSRGFYLMARLVVTLFVYGAQFKPQRQDHVNKWNGQDIMKWPQATSKNLAIVSTLVATVAFSAAFNVPGSYGSDGKANLNRNHTYSAFLVLDTIAMITSVMATILLVYGVASRSHRSWQGFIMSMHFLWLSLICMMLAFFEAISAVTSSDRKAMKSLLYQLTYAGVYVLINLLTKLAMPGSFVGVLQFVVGGFSKQQRCLKKRISQQYPFGVIYAFNMFMFIFVNTVAVAAMVVTSILL